MPQRSVALVDEALAADEAAVVALWQTCGLVAAGNDPAFDFRSSISRPNARVFVARRDGLVLGAIMTGEDGHRGWLYYVGVVPEHRGGRIGSDLVSAAERWLRARGIRRIDLMIREENAGVASFYTSLGYATTPRTVMQKRFDDR